MVVHNIEEVKLEAHAQLMKEDFLKAVAFEKWNIQRKKLHFFPKKIKFQWPLRFVEHHQPLNRRIGDKARTAGRV